MKRRGVFTAGGVVAGVATALSATMLMQGCPFLPAGGGGAAVNIDSAAGSATAGAPAVTVTASPGTTVNEGDLLQLDCNANVAVTIDLIGTASGGSGALTLSWAQTGGPASTLTDNGNGTASAATSAAGTYTYQFTATDGTNSASQSVTVDAGAIGVSNVSWSLTSSSCPSVGVRFTEEDDASTNFLTNIPGTFTARCTVQTTNGGTGQGNISLTVTDDPNVSAVTNSPTAIAPRRSALAGSGAGGVALGSNVVGATSQTWSVVSSPAGAGAVTIANASLAATTATVGPPMVAGAYIFEISATNGCDTVTGQVTMEVLDAPVLQVAAATVARRNVTAGTASIIMDLEANNSETTTYNIYSKETNASNAANQLLLASISVPNTGGGFQTQAVTMDLSGVPAGSAAMYLLGWEAIDSVGLTQAGGAVTIALAKAAADEPIASRTQAAITIGRSRTDGTLAAVTPGVAAAPNEPVGLTLNTEVGTPNSIGLANAPQAFAAGVVQYPGIGAAGGNTLTHNGGTFTNCVDLNGDGLGDYAYGDGTAIEVVFGAVDTLTNGGAPVGLGVAGGTAAANGAAANQDWQEGGAFVASVQSTFDPAATGNVVALTSGDFNNDGFLDLGYIALDGAAADDVGMVLLPGNAANLDPFTLAVDHFYNTDAADDADPGAVSGHNPDCVGGDFQGDGIDDLNFGLPMCDTGGNANAGCVFSIYGKAITGATLGSGFPGAVGDGLTATFAVDADGFKAGGAAVNDELGGGLVGGDFGGPTTIDLAFFSDETGANGDGEINTINGTNGGLDQVDDTISTQTITIANAQFDNGVLAVGCLFGAVNDELIVGLPETETGSNGGGMEGAVYVIPGASLPVAETAINTVGGTFVVNNLRTATDLGLGSGVGGVDYSGDGVDDLIVVSGTTVYVLNGPLIAGGINFNDTQNGFTFRLEGATSGTIDTILLDDLNGDGVADFTLVDGTANDVSVLTGLE